MGFTAFSMGFFKKPWRFVWVSLITSSLVSNASHIAVYPLVRSYHRHIGLREYFHATHVCLFVDLLACFIYGSTVVNPAKSKKVAFWL